MALVKTSKFIHVRANLSQVAASQVEGLAQAGIKKFAQ